MARTDPKKGLHKQAKNTLLIYGEGLNEEIFLKYLKSLYAHNKGIAIKIRRGKGGDPLSLVEDALKYPGEFMQRIVILDNDRDAKEMERARKKAKEEKLELIENTPCLEGTLLSILVSGKSFNTKSSPWCKKKFEEEYIGRDKRNDLEEYRKVFKKKILEAQRGNISQLSIIISYMENEMLG